MGRLDPEPSRLIPRSKRGELAPGFLEGIYVWTRLAQRDPEELDVYEVPEGIICVDQSDDAELHLVLEETPSNGKPLAVAVFMKELEAW